MTCVNAHRTTECEYEVGGASTRHSGHLHFLFWDGPGPSGSRDVYRRETVEEVTPELPTNLLPVTARTRLPPETVPPALTLIRPLAYNNLLFYTPPRPQPHTFNETKTFGLSGVALPPLSVVSSLVFPNILPGSCITLSLLGAGRHQLSDAALGDLNMKLYVSRAC